MHLTHVTAKNLNNSDFSLPISTCQIFAGTNGAGKSTILDAITLAVRGNHPAYPATNAGVAENFSSGASLVVAIEAVHASSSQPSRFSRSWTRKGKTVSATKEGDEAIALDMAMTLFSGLEFMMADPKQKAYILRSAFPTSGDPIQAIIDEVEKVDGFISYPDGARDLEFHTFVETWMEHVVEQRKNARQNVTRMKGTIQGLEQLASDLPVVGAPVTDEEITAAEAEAMKFISAHGTAQGLVDALPELPTFAAVGDLSLEAIEAELLNLNGQIATLQARTQQAAADRRARQDQRAGIMSRWQADKRAYEKAKREYDEALAWGAELGVNAGNACTIEAAKVSSKSIKEQAKPHGEESEKWTEIVAKLEAEIALLPTAEDGHCKCCGAAWEHWKADIVEASKNLRGRLTEAQGFKAAAVKLVNDAVAAFREAEQAEHKFDAAQMIITRSQELLANPDPGAEPKFDVPASDQADDEQLYALECSRDDLVDERQRLKDNAAYEEGTKKRAMLEADTEAARLVMEQKQAILADLRTRQKAHADRAAQAEKQAQAAAELENAEKDLAAGEATLTAIVQAADAEARKAVQPILDMAARFTDGIMSPPITVDGLKFGRWHGAHWQPITRLSGAEKAIAVAAISAALASFQQAKIVVIDEFAVFTAEWKARFMGNLELAMDEGVLDQVILFDHTPTERKGWTVTQV